METDYRTVKYMDKNIKILKYLSESESQFNKRLDYIKTLEEKNVNWKDAIRLSKLWYCIKFRKCVYSNEIQNSLI